MTRIHIEKTIETAEEAEAMVEGTIACGHCPDPQYGFGLVEKIGCGWTPRSATGIGTAPPDALVGWTALIPVEAEEEWTTDIAQRRWDVDAVYDSPENVRRDGWTDPLEGRYVTPWRPASDGRG